VVVSHDLAWCADATHIAPTLQAALDDWDRAEPQLTLLDRDLAYATIPRDRFHEREALAPLPRAFQWADGSAYVNHVQLVRKARGAEMPQSFWTDPLMYQGASDEMLPPRGDVALADESWGCDLEAEVVVVTGDVPRGVSREEALGHIRLVGLVNDVSLRNLIPDELGESWKDGKLHGPLKVDLNGRPFGRADAGEDMTFDFGTLIAHLAKTRNLGAGSIIGSGTVSNRDSDGGPGKPIEQGGLGYSCIAEVRTVETILAGKPASEFLKHGDRVRIWMDDEHGHPIFGVIEQQIVPA
jgi:fumarylacetoacetate (FAA) hydrolase